MRAMDRWTRVLLIVLLPLLWGCREEARAPEAGDTASDRDTAPAGPAPTSSVDTLPVQDRGPRAVLPGLFSIMAGLEGDMYTVGRGLWLADPDTVAAGARAVAGHPSIPAGEVERIRGVLGADLARFRELDMRVHDLAVQLGEEALAAGPEGLGDVLATEAELRATCVRCHDEFRARLRRGLR